MDTPSDQTSTQNDSTSSLTSQKRQVVTYDSERMALSYWMDRLQKLCARATNMEAIRESTRALQRTMQPFFDSRQLRLDGIPEEERAAAITPSSTKTTQPPANNNKPNTTRSIPKLPTFDGDILQFKAFWDQFNAIVHRREDLEDVTKFVHLRSNLAGAALNAINGVATAAENYLAVVIEGNWKESRHRCIRLPDSATTTGVPTAKGHTIPMERSTCGKLAEEPTSQTFLDFLAEHARRAMDFEWST
ncbi:hypothetical protein T02_8589 [Trichinella nativa]|uniref:Uncharacterized protein n=1 Tax=Trichinella nativa TaxID=6335 RepID=A0A0V1L2U8_9BILA|nr:hypothetical protein T02_8589 [Trichinella nativa]